MEKAGEAGSDKTFEAKDAMEKVEGAKETAKDAAGSAKKYGDK